MKLPRSGSIQGWLVSIPGRLRNMNPQLRLFVVGVLFLGVASGIFETTFNNFLSERHGIGADVRGQLEFPRELPGFLTAVMAGLLFFVPETMVAAVAALAVGGGMIMLARNGDIWPLMIVAMIMWSVGTHLMMPIRESVGMALAATKQRGRRLGQIAAAGIGGAFVGCLFVWVGMTELDLDYSAIFMTGGIAAIGAGIVFLAMRLPGAHLKRPRFVWRREFKLYYVLQILFGARKQIFMTFGPWVLVKIFEQRPYVFAQLWMASSVLGIVLQPALGRAIDRYGERLVLMADSVLVFLVCAGYGLSHMVGNRDVALWLLYICYVGDHLLFGIGMARSTYVSKVASASSDIAPTLSLGISINHVVSMSVPTVGGLVWVAWGHQWVFLGAAVIAVLMLVSTSRIRLKDV